MQLFKLDDLNQREPIVMYYCLHEFSNYIPVTYKAG